MAHARVFIICVFYLSHQHQRQTNKQTRIKINQKGQTRKTNIEWHIWRQFLRAKEKYFEFRILFNGSSEKKGRWNVSLMSMVFLVFFCFVSAFLPIPLLNHICIYILVVNEIYILCKYKSFLATNKLKIFEYICFFTVNFFFLFFLLFCRIPWTVFD